MNVAVAGVHPTAFEPRFVQSSDASAAPWGVTCPSENLKQKFSVGRSRHDLTEAEDTIEFLGLEYFLQINNCQFLCIVSAKNKFVAPKGLPTSGSLRKNSKYLLWYSGTRSVCFVHCGSVGKMLLPCLFLLLFRLHLCATKPLVGTYWMGVIAIVNLQHSKDNAWKKAIRLGLRKLFLHREHQHKLHCTQTLNLVKSTLGFAFLLSFNIFGVAKCGPSRKTRKAYSNKSIDDFTLYWCKCRTKFNFIFKLVYERLKLSAKTNAVLVHSMQSSNPNFATNSSGNPHHNFRLVPTSCVVNTSNQNLTTWLHVVDAIRRIEMDIDPLGELIVHTLGIFYIPNLKRIDTVPRGWE